MNRTLIMRVVSEDIQREFLTAFRGNAAIGNADEAWKTHEPYGVVFSPHREDSSSLLHRVYFTCQIFNGTSYVSTSFVTLSWSSGSLLIEVRSNRNGKRFDVTGMDFTHGYGLSDIQMVIDRVIFNANAFIDWMNL